MKRVLAILALVAIANAALAQASDEKRLTPEVTPTFGAEGVVVAPTPCRAIGTADAPHVASTYPAEGQKVPPGDLIVRVTYDRPMQACYAYTSIPYQFYPECLNRPVRSPDRRTFRLLCKVAAGRDYKMAFNNDKLKRFIGVNGTPAEPHVLSFATTGDRRIDDLGLALRQDPEFNPATPEAEPWQFTGGHAPVTGMVKAGPEVVVSPAGCRRLGEENRPKVVSTFPAEGATVRPGLLVMRVTFDRRMAEACYAYVENGGVMPPCRGRPILTGGGTTFKIVCTLGPNRTYQLSFNSRGFQEFIGINGSPAEPKALSFQSGSGPPITSLHEAMVEDPTYKPDLP
jgi:hypothetical protein